MRHLQFQGISFLEEDSWDLPLKAAYEFAAEMVLESKQKQSGKGVFDGTLAGQPSASVT
jgi:hypothetical protein